MSIGFSRVFGKADELTLRSACVPQSPLELLQEWLAWQAGVPRTYPFRWCPMQQRRAADPWEYIFLIRERHRVTCESPTPPGRWRCKVLALLAHRLDVKVLNAKHFTTISSRQSSLEVFRTVNFPLHSYTTFQIRPRQPTEPMYGALVTKLSLNYKKYIWKLCGYHCTHDQHRKQFTFHFRFFTSCTFQHWWNGFIHLFNSHM